MYTLTDNSTAATFDIADRFDLEDKLNELFDRDEYAYTDDELNDHTIGEVIDDLIAKLGREYTGGEEACLNITIA